MDANTFDKSKLPSRHVLPGVMMSMLRLNMPAVFMYSGSILPGEFKGRDVTVVDVFEAVGQRSAGNMSDERRNVWQPPANSYQSGALRRCADQVGPARKVPSRMPAERRK